MSAIASGTPAPNFKLATEDGGSFTEKDLKGERTVLVFYPFAFTGRSKGIRAAHARPHD